MSQRICWICNWLQRRWLGRMLRGTSGIRVQAQVQLVTRQHAQQDGLKKISRMKCHEGRCWGGHTHAAAQAGGRALCG